ncbi:Protein disulfide-isomerase, active site cysteins missing [Monocercomonoides exilis]|uniref:Protein disulfide-isomerase, active site cysteins missing n=1 Tax=Monocercomonoides exilis TaxID=2049356 RepID=UPI003559A059|nr:Protein disulfide-isomerase, active site cysteins missing [Monocercomonoides exilis]|eukprot:MONOS_2289.1-p1 / transcript=MONOS_2289.1 / gene=MONOS_2289 / organism=Monocercomonoides_exilis_PA203 / gene_product=Protein disulfide-isomerase, active site cysteins missing / transcript_product=Protein disulfide-isomerase, active site cysteins missing / location=Mono_scaffold00046:109629-112382(-) / protein_length=587 / sequence_SO=supercontig / SO=protein_coding / is_pseudo=false
MQPEFYKMVDELPDYIKAGEIDCEQYDEDCRMMDINEYPKVKFYVNGTSVGAFEYDYTYQNMLQFADKMSNSAVVTVTTHIDDRRKSYDPSNFDGDGTEDGDDFISSQPVSSSVPRLLFPHLTTSSYSLLNASRLLRELQKHRERASFVLISPMLNYHFDRLATVHHAELPFFYHLCWPATKDTFIPDKENTENEDKIEAGLKKKKQEKKLDKYTLPDVEVNDKAVNDALSAIGVTDELKEKYIKAVKHYLREKAKYDGVSIKLSENESATRSTPPTPPSLLIVTANGTSYNHRCPSHNQVASYGPSSAAQQQGAVEEEFTIPSFDHLLRFYNVYQNAQLASFAVDMAKKTKIDDVKTVIAIVNGTKNKRSKKFIEAFHDVSLKYETYALPPLAESANTMHPPRSALSKASPAVPFYTFIVVDHTRFPGFTAIFNISSKVIPDVFVVNWKNNTNWTLPASASPETAQNWTKNKMFEFLDKIQSGKLKPNGAASPFDFLYTPLFMYCAAGAGVVVLIAIIILCACKKKNEEPAVQSTEKEKDDKDTENKESSKVNDDTKEEKKIVEADKADTKGVMMRKSENKKTMK